MHYDRSAAGLGGNFGAGPYTYYQLLQTPGYVALIMEAFHDARIIPLDGRPHLSERIRQWNGDSRGHWEGDTLVVDTRNFSSNSYFRGATEGLHLVERFTRTAQDTLTYRMTFTDPTTWATSWTAEMPLKRKDQALYEFACHEGNYSIVGMLATARLEEAAAEAAKARRMIRHRLRDLEIASARPGRSQASQAGARKLTTRVQKF